MSDVLTTAPKSAGLRTDHVIALRSDLDLAAVPSLTEEVRGAVDAGHRRIVLDLAELRFVDSTGLGCIAGLTRESAEVGATLTVTNPSTMTEQVLRLTGLDRAVSVRS